MALLEDGLKGMMPNVLIGVGIALAAPILLPATAAGIRPLAKTLVKGYLAVADSAKEMFAEAGEQLSDLVAEARAERASTETSGGTGAAPHDHTPHGQA